MKTDFKLIGLVKPHSYHCELNDGTTFFATGKIQKEKFDELFNYCKGNWNDFKIAQIEHDGFYDNGIPINPIITEIREI